MDKILGLIKSEENRQKQTLMMIPSENYTYPEVFKAVGSVLMQRYSEGLPGKRYYQGLNFIDEIELLCQKRALKAFRLSNSKWSVNVQALSGAPANLAVYNALLSPGDKILSLSLPDGGHLSHGWHISNRKITLVSKIWNVSFYHVNEKDFLIDYDKLENQALKLKPKLIVSGGTAYPRQIDHQRISQIAKKAGAYYLADVAHEAGLIAGKANASPFSYADVVTMTTHKTLRGPRGALIFSKKELSEKIDASVFPGIQGGPHNEVIAGIAIALEKATTSEFKKYAFQVVKNAKSLANKLEDLGFNVVTNGTDKHLLLIDLRDWELNGWFASWALESCGIIVNRNTVPRDTASAFYPSGIRLGTPALTVRGMKEKEMQSIATLIGDCLSHLEKVSLPIQRLERQKVKSEFLKKIKKDKFFAKIRKEAEALCKKFPINF